MSVQAISRKIRKKEHRIPIGADASRSSSSLTSFPPFFFSRLFVTLPRHTIRPQARAFPVISAFRLSCVSLILFIEPFYVYIRRS